MDMGAGAEDFGFAEEVDSEAAEAEFMYQYVTHAPAALGASATRLAGGVVLHLRHDPMRYWTQALGFDQPVNQQLLEAILAFYRSRGAPSAVLHFNPHLLPPGFMRLAGSLGITEGRPLLKLGCPIEQAGSRAETSLRVGPVGEPDAQVWGEVVMAAFGVPGTPLSQMAAAALQNPAFRPFAAWDGDRMVAVGNLLVHGSVGSLNTGATLPQYRGRGAQSALIAARIEAARAAGCRWLFAETGKAAAGTSNPSTQNLLRAGLQLVAERPSWKWQA